MMLGALVIASTSLTSCKDYDDDIQNLQNQITNNLNALNEAKTELNAKIATLQGRIEAAEAQIAANKTAIDGLRTDVNKNAAAIEKLQGQVADNTAKIAALEARMATAEQAIKDINALIVDLQNNKVDKSEFNEKITDIYGKLEAIETNLGNALKRIEGLEKGLEDEIVARKAVEADLAQQKVALANLEKRVKAIEDDYLKAADKAELQKKIDDAKKALQDQIDALKNRMTTAEGDIKTLKSNLETLSKKVDALQAEVNVLNVLVKNSLRSLVFIPEGYYHGIEATSFNYLEAFKYNNVPEAKWNVQEKRGYYKDSKEPDPAGVGPRTAHNRYDSVKVALVEDLWAQYHLNPSNVDVDNFSTVDVLSGDKWFENTRSATKADAGLSVKAWNVKDGILNVQIDVKDPEQIKAVVEDYWAEGQEKPMVTVFASQVTLNKAGKDTTVTSDYATLFADKVTDLRIAHVNKATNPYATGQTNTHCGVCDLNHHVMATVHEAVEIAANHNDADVHTNAQDKVHYKSTLDLRKVVETHWTMLDGKHKAMTAKELEKFGLSYKFELTSLKLGTNATDESAHAAILDDGYTFRPQLPRKKGTAYEQVDPNASDIADFIGEKALQAVGRTPVVRVSLVDKNGNILDYGYIRIEITGGVPPTEKEPLVVSYDGTNKTYQDVCPSINPTGYAVYATKWIQTEYDIYKELGVDRATFEAHFKEEPVLDGSNEVQQWKYVGNAGGPDMDGWEPLDVNDYVGVITFAPDMDDETHTQTSTLKWVLNDEDVQKLYRDWDKQSEKTYELQAVAKYTDVHGAYAHYKNVYIVFKTKVTFKPYSLNDLNVKVDWSNAKIAKYWYVKNTTEMGKDELHTNVPSVEDQLRIDADSLTNLFSNEFLNNKVVSRDIVTGASGFNYGTYTYRLVFDAANNGKQFKGASGTTYTLKVSNDGRELLTSNNVKIARLVVLFGKEGDKEEANYTMIEYLHTKAAHDLLNYCSHNEFNAKNDAVLNNFLNVIISLAIQGADECKPIKVENGTFNVRFLRPLDVTDGNKEIEDASTEGKQIIQLNGLFDYQDWRNAWKGVNRTIGDPLNYFDYYGIKGIRIEGLVDGDKLSTNRNVKADLNNTGMKALYTITSQLDFTYHEDDQNGNYLEYNNLSSTVQEFKLEIPVVVEYIWGEFYTKATVTVKRTAGHAKQF
ncbi:MAG: hypothetical protein SPL55_06695 [Prevotella sp.]|nr:hypothetical protein [Prevotella sp.]